MDLENIGSIFLRKGLDHGSRQDLLAGLGALQECVSIRGPSNADASAGFTVLNNIGIIFNELGEHRESRTYFHQALRAVEKKAFVPEKGQILSNIAASYLYESRFDEAIRRYRESYDIGVANSLENVVIESCFGLGKCYELTQAPSAAIDFYQRSIGALENVRERLSSELLTIGFSRNKLAAYQSLIDLLTAAYHHQPSPGMLERIFGFMERAKARAFLQRIQDADIQGTARSSSHLKERQKRLSQNIAELTERLAGRDLPEGERRIIQHELEHAEEEDLRVTLGVKEHPQAGLGRAPERICRRQDVQSRILDDRTILLEYFMGEARSYLILVKKKGMELFVLAGKAELEKSLRAYLKIISERSVEVAVIHGASERIGRELLPFLEEAEYADASSLIIVPDGVLHDLPFETLRVRHGNGTKYLIEDYSVSYGPSASSILALHAMRKDLAWKKDLLAFGGPLYDPGLAQENGAASRQGAAFRRLWSGQAFDFPPLPYSQQEVREVARLFSNEKVEVFVGEAASEDIVKALPLKDYRIIHFACHGLLDENHPLRSALVLSLGGEPANDGFLEMREIYGLVTAADLIVLSACRTARGFLDHAEGPMGIARSFFFTGARSVLASLWSVNDRPAVVFMREFYGNLLSGRTAKEALRLAKLTLLQSSWSHPYYWASFILIGDPGAGLSGPSGK
jgi:CHAT domain-containing protein